MADSTRRIAYLAGIVTVALLALSPAAASAAVSCTFNAGTGALGVSVTNGTTAVTLSHAASPGTELLVNGSSACAGGTPTDTTTSSITVDENGSNQGTTLTVNFLNGRLAPGLGAETDTPEIEISYLADTTGTDTFTVNGSTESADQAFQFGATGPSVMAGNLNGDADADDVTLTGVDRLTALPGTGNDTFTGDGTGSGSFTGPVPAVMSAAGSQGNDTFATGTGSNNILTGGPGNDSLTGGSNTDTLDMAEGNDTINGGGGIDFAPMRATHQPRG
jgi:Ca2+-binding RTX toxin-like protein